MAILTASQLQTRATVLARGLLGLVLVWGATRVVLHLLRSPVQCLPPQPVPHSTIDPSNADSQTLANEADTRTLRCEAGYVIDGFQPLSSALMVCKNGVEGGEWECSATVDDVDDEASWLCADRACVEVSYCDPLSDRVDTGCAFTHAA